MEKYQEEIEKIANELGLDVKSNIPLWKALLQVYENGFKDAISFTLNEMEKYD